VEFRVWGRTHSSVREKETKNGFEDLGFSPEEAAALKLKADLHTTIVKFGGPLLAKATASPSG
jgi:hypothetical protein